MLSNLLVVITMLIVLLTAPTLGDAVFAHLARAASTNSGNIARTVSGVADVSGAKNYVPFIGPGFAIATAGNDYYNNRITALGAVQTGATSIVSSALATYGCSALGIIASPFATMGCIGAVGYVTSTSITSVIGQPNVPQITICEQMRSIVDKVPSRFSHSYLEYDGNTCDTSFEWVKAPFNENTYDILLSNGGPITIIDRSGDFVIRYKFFGDKELNIAQKLNGAIVTDEPISDFVTSVSNILY